jgi:hypothetical protein
VRFVTSRKHPPHPFQNRLWKAGYAWLSFQYVVDLCDHILSEGIQPDAPIYYPLVTAIIVLYARPFKHSKGIESLTLQFVPKEFHNLHHQLILLRDKTTAHVDARSVSLQGLPANNVVLSVREHGNRIRLAVQQVKFKTLAIPQIRGLATALVKRMLGYIKNVANENPNNVPDDGDYLIDLTIKTFRRL